MRDLEAQLPRARGTPEQLLVRGEGLVQQSVGQGMIAHLMRRLRRHAQQTHAVDRESAFLPLATQQFLARQASLQGLVGIPPGEQDACTQPDA
jgi:hypothetical protein